MKSKVDSIDVTGYVSKTKFEKDIKDLDDSIDNFGKIIPGVSGLATKSNIASLLAKSTFNSKVTEIEGKITNVDNKIPNISGLTTKTELITVENKKFLILVIW